MPEHITFNEEGTAELMYLSGYEDGKVVVKDRTVKAKWSLNGKDLKIVEANKAGEFVEGHGDDWQLKEISLSEGKFLGKLDLSGTGFDDGIEKLEYEHAK